MIKFVNVSVEDYIELKIAEYTLQLLEQGGLDNWEGCGESLHSNDLDELE